MSLETTKYTIQNCFGTEKMDYDKSLLTLKTYVENKIKYMCDLSIFESQGFSYNVISDPNVSIRGTRGGDTIFDVNYSIQVQSSRTNQITELSDFKAKVKLDILEFYKFLDELLTREVSNPGFDIRNGISGYDSLGLTITTQDVSDDPDVSINDFVFISSSNLELYGKPFNFTFLRQNRYPVLGYIEQASFPADVLWDCDDKTKLTINGEQRTINVWDPDEDLLAIYLFHTGDGVVCGETTQVDSLLVEVYDDREKKDYQNVQ
jgi:hypothetical protein